MVSPVWLELYFFSFTSENTFFHYDVLAAYLGQAKQNGFLIYIPHDHTVMLIQISKF